MINFLFLRKFQFFLNNSLGPNKRLPLRDDNPCFIIRKKCWHLTYDNYHSNSKLLYTTRHVLIATGFRRPLLFCHSTSRQSDRRQADSRQPTGSFWGVRRRDEGSVELATPELGSVTASVRARPEFSSWCGVCVLCGVCVKEKKEGKPSLSPLFAPLSSPFE